MTIKVTVPNTSSDSLTFGSANTPTAAQVIGIDSGSSNGQLAFNTTASGTSTERMRIDSSGNVGVGTNSPGLSKLAISGSSSTSYVGVNMADTLTGKAYNIQSNNSSLIFYDSSSTLTERARIDSSGNLLVGKTAVASTTVGFQVIQDGTVYSTLAASTAGTNTNLVYSTGAAAFRFYVGMEGKVYCTSTTITGISDVRLKENIRDLDDGLDKVMALKPRKFDWKEGKGQDIKDARGFIAQEFETVFPDMIDAWMDEPPEGEEPYKAVNANLIPTLVKAIQELKAIVDTQAAKIAALEAK